MGQNMLLLRVESAHTPQPDDQIKVAFCSYGDPGSRFII